MQKIRMGIIGAGMALEKLHYPAYQELSDKYQIVALADVEVEKARTWAGKLGLNPEKDAYGDYRELLKRTDIDAFDITTVLDTGVHDMAMLRHISGAVEKLQAFGVPQNDDFAPYAAVAGIGYPSDISSVVLLRPQVPGSAGTPVQ